jgi:hypothetical protein
MAVSLATAREVLAVRSIEIASPAFRQLMAATRDPS